MTKGGIIKGLLKGAAIVDALPLVKAAPAVMGAAGTVGGALFKAPLGSGYRSCQEGIWPQEKEKRH